MSIKRDEIKGEQSEPLKTGEKVVPLSVPDAIEQPQEPLIYLGPNISGGVLSGNTVFKGGKPAHIDLLIAEQPEIGDLIVPVKSINDTLAKINKVGTAEHQAYQALIKRGTGAK